MWWFIYAAITGVLLAKVVHLPNVYISETESESIQKTFSEPYWSLFLFHTSHLARRSSPHVRSELIQIYP